MAKRTAETSAKSSEEIAALLERAEEHLEGSEYALAEATADEVLAFATEGNTLSGEDDAQSRCILGRCCLLTARYREARTHFDTALAAAETAGKLSLQSRAMLGIAGVQMYLGDIIEGIQTAERALALAEKAQDGRLVAKALGALGWCYRRVAEYSRALDCFTRALTISENIGDRAGLGELLQQIGTVHSLLGAYPLALDYFTRSLTLAQEYSLKSLQANSLGSLANTHSTLGDYPRALDYYSRSLALCEEIGTKLEVAANMGNIGIVYQYLNDNSRALDYHSIALRLAEEIGNKADVARHLGNIGTTYSSLADYPLAREYYDRALALCKAIGDARQAGYWMNGIGSVEYELGNFAAANEAFLSSLKHRREVLHSNEDIPDTLMGLGLVRLKEERFDEALAFFVEALELADEHGDKRVASGAHEYLAATYELIGDSVKAYTHLKANTALEREIFSEESRKKVEAFNFRVAIENKERDTKLARLEAEQAVAALRLKERDLANTASSLAAQTELLGNFRADLRKIVLRPDRYEPEDIIKQVRAKLKELPCEMIDFSKFEGQFATVHPEFRAKLEMKYPELTAQEVKMCMLIHVNLKTPAVARLMCLSERTVDNHRFNIRKKMALKTEEHLTDHLRKLDGGK
jgi:tetratricopeptide (TPR) repeat protein/DNA-binding CsgD family transcriptional regulator